MDLMQYARVLSAHRLLILGAIVVCTAAAAALAWTRDPMYTARTELFVSTTQQLADPSASETYQGSLFTQQRMTSYAEVVASPPVVRAVIRQLGLSESVGEIQAQIDASVDEGTVLIDVAVTNGSPELAARIANAIGDEFPRFISTLESAGPGQNPPVKVSVTSPAPRPTSPVSPQKALYLLLGALLGAVIGITAAVLRETLDRRIRDDTDAAAIARAPVLSRIADDPKAASEPLVVIDQPDSANAEAYRSLRTYLRALGLDRDKRSFVVTSAAPSEGKTLVVANLALVFAQAGMSVIVVDADMRRPQLAERFGIDSPLGLSNVLADQLPVESASWSHPSIPLTVLPSGPPPPNPSELLGSETYASLIQSLIARADIVLIDTPALLPVTDAVIAAGAADTVVLVARAASTRARQLELAAEAVRAIGKEPLGVVLNGVQRGDYTPYGGQRVAAMHPIEEQPRRRDVFTRSSA
jgi:succinoglycan biosynthesis transport protein ExoP